LKASVIGKRFGRHQWTVGSPKTFEGSFAFATSVVAGALFLRLLGLTEPFSVSDMSLAVDLANFEVNVALGTEIHICSHSQFNLRGIIITKRQPHIAIISLGIIGFTPRLKFV
jgi:CDP-diglyceride synthetase